MLEGNVYTKQKQVNLFSEKLKIMTLKFIIELLKFYTGTSKFEGKGLNPCPLIPSPLVNILKFSISRFLTCDSAPNVHVLNEVKCDNGACQPLFLERYMLGPLLYLAICDCSSC